MTRVSPVASLVGVALAAVALGCGHARPETVDPRRPANVEAQLDGLAARVARAPLTARPAGFAALSAAGELLFVDSAGATTFQAPSDARDVSACGEAICEIEAERLRLRAWPAGAAWGALPRSRLSRFVGASVEADRLAWVESDGPRQGHLVLVTLRGGGATVEHELPADGDLGAPLLRGGVALLPHDGHELLFLDAQSGHELARRRSPDDTIRWARVDAQQVYYGGERAYALRAGSANQRRADAVLDPDLLLVPAPPFHARLQAQDEPLEWAEPSEPPTDPAGPRPAPVHWTRVPLEPSAVPAEDRAYVVSRGHVFAFDGLGALLFVHPLRAPPLATLATADGLMLLHTDGQLQALHPDDGSLRFERSLPALRVARSVPAIGARQRTEPARDAPPPSRALLGVLSLHDTRFVSDQVYAVHLLTAARESVAAQLLDVYVEARTEPPVRDAVAMTLRARSEDTDALVQALGQRYDFLASGGARPAPPLEAILPALARAERYDAYGALLGHLEEPATALAVLPLLVDQLVRWGGPDALPPLVAFVRRYRADSSFEGDPTALVQAALAIDALGGDDERRQLNAWVAEAGTQPAIAAALARARRNRGQAAGGGAVEADPHVPSEPSPTAAPSTRVASAASVEARAAAQMDRLEPCLLAARAADPGLRGVRVRMVLEREGRVSLVAVLPGGDLERCLADVLVTIDWPHIQVLRQQVGFTLRFAPEPPPPAANAPAWWQQAATRAQGGMVVQPGLAWWESPDGRAPASPDGEDTWWQPSDSPVSPDTLDRWWRPTP